MVSCHLSLALSFQKKYDKILSSKDIHQSILDVCGAICEYREYTLVSIERPKKAMSDKPMFVSSIVFLSFTDRSNKFIYELKTISYRSLLETSQILSSAELEKFGKYEVIFFIVLYYIFLIFNFTANHLSLYQVLGGNARPCTSSYVPSIGKQVKSRLYSQSMVEFVWHDGTTRLVHVDPVRLDTYVAELNRQLDVYKRRMEKLRESSRRLFGNIHQDSFTVIFDMTAENEDFQDFTKLCLKLFLEEHVLQKSSVSVICFNDEVHYKSISPINKENIQKCWRQLNSLEFKGRRTFRPSLTRAHKECKSQESHAVYLITTGLPADPISELEQLVSNRNVSVVYLQLPRDSQHQQTAETIKSLVKRGSFHCSYRADVVENESMRVLAEEMNKAGMFIEQAKMLLEKTKPKNPKIPSPSVTNVNCSSLKVKQSEPYQQRRVKSAPVQRTTIKSHSCTPISTTAPPDKTKHSPRKLTFPVHAQMTSSDWLKLHGLTKVKALRKSCKCESCSCGRVSKVWSPTTGVKCLFKSNLENLSVAARKRLEIILTQESYLAFGSVVEDRVVVFIDSSGSMSAYMDHLKGSLVSLVYQQFFKYNKKFSLVNFATSTDCLSANVAMATDEYCKRAVYWTHEIHCEGGSQLLHAIQFGFTNFSDAQAFYVISDGRPDCSMAKVRREVGRLNEDLAMKINTVLFNCPGSSAEEFLRLLASENGGRYHQYSSSTTVTLDELLSKTTKNPQSAALMENNEDVRLLVKEIQKVDKLMRTRVKEEET